MVTINGTEYFRTTCDIFLTEAEVPQHADCEHCKARESWLLIFVPVPDLT